MNGKNYMKIANIFLKNKYIIKIQMLSVIFCFFLLPLKIYGSNRPEIYDCFLFFNELDILDIRFNELYEAVDKFVLVEASETFRGNPKPNYFHDNKKRYEKFLDKVIYVSVEDNFNTSDPWARERFQRDQILRGLVNCKDNDIIIVSDVDEIIKASLLPSIIEPLINGQADKILCEQTLYRYFINRLENRIWPGPYVVLYKDIKTASPDVLRLQRENFKKAHGTGWHFTSMGGWKQWLEKLSAYSHAETDIPQNRDRNYIRHLIDSQFKLVAIDNTYPKYILERYSYFVEKGFIDIGSQSYS